MTIALVLVTIGMLTPYVLYRLNGRGPTSVVVSAHLSALAIVWIGVLDVAVGAVGLSHRLAEFCNLALLDSPPSGGLRPALATIVVTGMAGRGVHRAWHIARTTRRTRRKLLTMSTRTVDGVALTPLGSVACTVGLLQPRIFVDDTMFPALPLPERDAVLAHERVHVRWRHGLIDLAARCMAAGLAPWPGARLAQREVRRHLEAAADDQAAAHTGRRIVATAIVMAATMPPRPALGAAGWSAWRVDRMLDPAPRRHHPLVGVAMLLILLAALALAQTVSHALAGIHLVPTTFPAV